jgi:hypothetical protein
LNSGLVASSSLFWIRTTSPAFSGYALKTALSALPDSPTPDSWSFSVSAGSAFIPIKVATTTNASQPKIAFLRCRALQWPIRAARFLLGGGGVPAPLPEVWGSDGVGPFWMMRVFIATPFGCGDLSNLPPAAAVR